MVDFTLLKGINTVTLIDDGELKVMPIRYVLSNAFLVVEVDEGYSSTVSLVEGTPALHLIVNNVVLERPVGEFNVDVKDEDVPELLKLAEAVVSDVGFKDALIFIKGSDDVHRVELIGGTPTKLKEDYDYTWGYSYVKGTDLDTAITVFAKPIVGPKTSGLGAVTLYNALLAKGCTDIAATTVDVLGLPVDKTLPEIEVRRYLKAVENGKELVKKTEARLYDSSIKLVNDLKAFYGLEDKPKKVDTKPKRKPFKPKLV